MNIAPRVALVGWLGLVFVGSASLAQEPRPLAIGGEARARLDSLIGAYRALPAYADQGEVTLVVKVGDRELKQVKKARVAFVRPNQLDVETDLIRLLSDGKSVTTSVTPLKKYFVTPLPRKFAESTLRAARSVRSSSAGSRLATGPRPQPGDRRTSLSG